MSACFIIKFSTFRLRFWGKRATLTLRSSTKVWSNQSTLWTRSCMLVVFLSWLTIVPQLQDWDLESGLLALTTFSPNKLWLPLTTVQPLTKTLSATSSLTQFTEQLKFAPSWDLLLTFLFQLMPILFAQNYVKATKMCQPELTSLIMLDGLLYVSTQYVLLSWSSSRSSFFKFIIRVSWARGSNKYNVPEFSWLFCPSCYVDLWGLC